jgi:hypothetical protein
MSAGLGSRGTNEIRLGQTMRRKALVTRPGAKFALASRQKSAEPSRWPSQARRGVARCEMIKAPPNWLRYRIAKRTRRHHIGSKVPDAIVKKSLPSRPACQRKGKRFAPISG